ncbi:HK97 gp10 family phage protein [Tianweitania sp. BSSL-BM11]|uniref:HK97 gp10 family phage protein n=1 Tax=Tianweitania aestuarii TaxID=2814886 RepID=A0ABS5RT57_9HYPH|nr:HK97-gp10 family putative phage morphogenesis protein [Tianweitania aestuarii]MBS9720234.1 HK97 gp10 family phage protein [Tianweitania aestuarii]
MASGIKAFQRRLNRLPKAMKDAVQPALDASADEMVSMAQRLAPRDDGALYQSIRKEAGDHELERVVRAGGPATTRPSAGGPFDYAVGQEFGTVKQPAHPFFYPAYRLIKKRVRGRLKRAVSKAVKDSSNG